ncbi:acyl-CoA thioesterase [Saccharicrinis sp. FJH54]|uniref:acyl-CoA thioesterase n=1 Tax=Saccharicrinis sp. FJH54 TaxID=3344665 RepID=UPI0035D3DF02
MKQVFQFELDMAVRDYECDFQGIVNNAVYQNYMEHTRHEFIKTKGLDIMQLHSEGIDLVVARLEIAYQMPLKSGDIFKSCLNFRKDGLKYLFQQEIYRLSDMKRAIKATITGVAMVNGKLAKVDKIDVILQDNQAG